MKSLTETILDGIISRIDLEPATPVRIRTQPTCKASYWNEITRLAVECHDYNSICNALEEHSWTDAEIVRDYSRHTRLLSPNSTISELMKFDILQERMSLIARS